MSSRIHLAPFTPDDFKTLIAWIPDEALLTQFAGPVFTYPLTEEQLMHYLHDTNRSVFKVVDSTTKCALGHAEIYNNQDGSVRLCRVLIGDTKYRGQGLGEAIIQQLVDFSVKELYATSITLNVYEWNIGAIKCYEKVGFVLNPAYVTTTPVGAEVWKSVRMDWKG